jgi:hypothetical protein
MGSTAEEITLDVRDVADLMNKEVLANSRPSQGENGGGHDLAIAPFLASDEEQVEPVSF